MWLDTRTHTSTYGRNKCVHWSTASTNDGPDQYTTTIRSKLNACLTDSLNGWKPEICTRHNINDAPLKRARCDQIEDSTGCRLDWRHCQCGVTCGGGKLPLCSIEPCWNPQKCRPHNMLFCDAVQVFDFTLFGWWGCNAMAISNVFTSA